MVTCGQRSLGIVWDSSTTTVHNLEKGKGTRSGGEGSGEKQKDANECNTDPHQRVVTLQHQMSD